MVNFGLFAIFLLNVFVAAVDADAFDLIMVVVIAGDVVDVETAGIQW